MTTASAEAAYPPAGLERRFLAFTLDRLVAWSAYAGLAWLAWWLFWSDGATWAGVGVLAGGVLVVSGGLAVLAGLTGLSPGRAATGLRLVDASSGEPLGVGRALLRALLLGLATIPTFGFGVATLAWTALSDPGRRRRGWHDRRVGSEVVDVRPVEEEDEELIHEVPRQMVNLTAMRLVPSGPAAPHAAPQQQAPPQPAPQQSPPDQPSPPREPGSPRPGAPDPRTPAPRTPDPAAPGPSPSPPRQQLQGPLRPDPEPDAPDAPEAPAARTSPANAAPGGTAVAAGSTPAGTVIPSDRSHRSERPGRHRGRDRGRGRNAPEPPAPPAPPRWKVTFDTGEGFVVEGVVLVGRRPEARPGERVSRAVALPSQDMSLSKTHAQLHLADGVLVVMDRGSTNGSVLNRKGVARDLAPNRPTTLVDGDRVRFGDREMRVEKAG